MNALCGPVITQNIKYYFPLFFSKERVYISSSMCSDWMFTINHPIAVNNTNTCGAPYKERFT